MTYCRLRVRGLVQGVGFRPYVWRLANDLGLLGWVRNDAEGVLIEAAGSEAALAALQTRLRREAPPLARIDAIEVSAADPVTATSFTIEGSGGGQAATAIGPDAALCPECAADLCDPANRRWRYAFTTCTHCGPRYTVSRGVPYDRALTSLAPFPLCPACAAEYEHPADRRFHAETTCCPDCGPQLQYLDAAGLPVAGDPIATTLAGLRAGKIIAIKGLGGFHLVCDARQPAAVAELRQRKQREAKPFAVMALNVASLAGLTRIGAEEAKQLSSREAPIVLCPKGPEELAEVAPGLPWLGAMLPATPLHLLLWHEAAGRPAGTAWREAVSPLVLVMTSANPHGEPLVTGNDEARERLAGIADGYLMHNRDIVVRCDDSVVRPAGRKPAFIRRARGYTPVPVKLVEDGPDVLAFGAHLKNTLCLTRGRQAFLSQHIGGLDNAAAIGFQEEVMAHLLDILAVTPAAVAHDLHPDYAASRLAADFAASHGIPALAVGHHHAHIAAVCAEHGLSGPVLGLAIDGVGLGADGGLWGGELLRVDGADCQRLGHLSPLALPGGDRAAREPWRMAVSALAAMGRQAEIPDFLARHYPGKSAGPILLQLERGINCPATTSLGRLFDAAAGLLGLRAESRYEGQAAMELEGLAVAHGATETLPDGFRLTEDGPEFAGLLSFLADCREAGRGAAIFHATLAEGLVRWLRRAVEQTGITQLACAGGCAMNTLLMAGLRQGLAETGLRLWEARRVPPNDGGLALGQAWVARKQLETV